MARIRIGLALALAAVTLLAACGSSTKKPSAANSTFRGVTPTTIKVGVAIIDFNCIKQFVDFNMGDQKAIDQVMIDDLNNHGGILGRKIVPVYRSYCSIGNTQALQLCTSFTEDDKVFAVLGLLYDTTGDAQLCLSRDHQTVYIGHEMQDAWINQAPPGLMLTPDISAERLTNVLMNLVKQRGTLKGKKVATLADQDTAASVNKVIKPDLDALGVQQGSPAVVSIPQSGDTSQAQAQMDSFIEKWKGQGVDALVLAGLNVVSKQFVEKIKAGMPNVILLTDGESSAQQAAQDETTAGKSPNPYDGMLTANGLSDSATFNEPNIQKCMKTYETGSGQTVVGPDQLKPGPDGKRVETWASVRDFCDELAMFQEIATKAGVNLNNTTWSQAASNYGHIYLPEYQYASIHTGKFDADDSFQLVAFDSTIAPHGDWKALTPLADASK